MKICILGAGAYALALAHLFKKNDNEIFLWSYSKEEANELNEKRETIKLPGYKIEKELIITANIKESLLNSKLIVIALPAYAVKETCKLINKYINKDAHILIGTKAIDKKLIFMSEVVKENTGSSNIAILGGPTFAIDIVKDVPIGFTLASQKVETLNLVNKSLKSDKVIIRSTKDVHGTEVCSFIKNVIAIALGVLNGMEASDSTKALFLTKAINETKDLVVLLGGKEETILSLAGLGDTLMTSLSANSRNYSFGKLIGEGKELDAKKYLESNTVEGYYTLNIINKLLNKKNIKMDFISSLYDIINGNKEKEELLKF